MGIALSVILALTATVYFVQAASISNRVDVMSTQVISADARHRVSFKLSAGNSFSAGEQLVVDFPAAQFTIGGLWSDGDFTFNDGSARTIATVEIGPGTSTVTCSGANSVGVAIDTTGLVFRVIACTGYTVSSAGATITFTIDGTGPSGTLSNPGSVGSYTIYVPDAGGDCSDPLTGICSLTVSINDSSTVGVSAVKTIVCGNNVVEFGEDCDPPGGPCTATCQAAGGGGGGGGGGGEGGGDITSPVISGVSAISITVTEATIVWTTNEAANSTVHYGLTAGYGSTSADSGFLTDHSRGLASLSELTTYHYKVCSADPAGNSACSDDATFVTAAAPDSTPPTIFNESVTVLSSTSVLLTWDTDEPATSYVDYGLVAGPPYASTGGSGGLVTAHSVTLSGLTEDTVYHYRLRSGDASANERITLDGTFKTSPPPDTTKPVISDIVVTELTPTSIRVTWKTNEPATSHVDYGLAAGPPYAATQSVAGLVTVHSVDLTSLTNSTTYYLRVRSADAADNEAVGAETSFKLSDSTPPVISGIGVSGIINTGATVYWTTDEPTSARLEYGQTPAYGLTRTVIELKTDHSITLSGLATDTTYYFRINAADALSNSSSATGSFKTLLDVIPPSVVTGLVATPGDGKVGLSWVNPVDPDWIGTRIVRLPGADPTAYDNGTLIYDGGGDNVLDDYSIVNGTTYHYAAFAHDAVPNYAAPARAQATPVAGLLEPEPAQCSDTDGGVNFDVGGIVTVADDTFFDTCVSSTTLTEYYCDGDTQASETHDCGSGFNCIGGRCVLEGAEQVRCGDGLCQEPENSSNCIADCPLPPTEPEVVPEGEVITGDEEEWPDGIVPETRLKFYATAGRVVLRLGANNTLTVFPRMTVTAVIPDESLDERPTKVAYVNFLGHSYEMKPTHSLEVDFVSQPDISTKPLQVVLDYVDGTSQTYDIKVKTLPHGRVYEIDDQGHEVPVPGARVSLFIDQGGGNFGLWPGDTYNQANPQMTDNQGNYGYIVAWGSYKLIVEESSFLTKQTLAFPVSVYNVITQDLRLIRKPPEVIQDIVDIMNSDASTGDKILGVAAAAQGQVSYAATVATESVKEFVANPYVEERAEQTVTPIATVVAVANIASYGAATATGIPYIVYLYSLLMHPALLVARRRRRSWGIVFNSLTNLPLDLVIVRLLDAKTGRVVRSSVTDKDGRYLFMVSPGQYKITVAKAGYVFPTVFLKGQTEAGSLADLYHGALLDIKEDTTLTLNIAMDSLTPVDVPRKILWSGIARRSQKAVGIAAIIFMVGAVIITPKAFTIGMLCANVIIYFMFQRLSVTKQPKSWGMVYDEKTKQPLRNALARIFDAKYNKLLETQVTDSRGHYAFLVGRNVYYVTFEKPGYTHQQRGPVDLLDAKKVKEGVINMDVPLVVSSAPPAASAPGLKPSAPPIPPGAPTPPKAPAPPIAPASPAPEKKIPWELQFLKKGSMPTPPTAPPPAAPPSKPPTPPAPPPVSPPKNILPAAGMMSPRQLIQDVEHAHPDVKLVQDAEHAHPSEARTIQPPSQPPVNLPDDKTVVPPKPVKK